MTLDLQVRINVCEGLMDASLYTVMFIVYNFTILTGLVYTICRRLYSFYWINNMTIKRSYKQQYEGRSKILPPPS